MKKETKAPPSPQEGGSYREDPKTGKLVKKVTEQPVVEQAEAEKAAQEAE